MFEKQEDICGCGAVIKNDVCSDLLQHSHYLVTRLETKNEEIDYLEAEIRVLKEQLGAKILLRARDYLTLKRMTSYPYNADELAYLYYGIEFLTDLILEKFRK